MPIQEKLLIEASTKQHPAKTKQLSIALVSVINKNIDYAQNKDLNGGFGTADNYQGFKAAPFVRFIKKHAVKLPVITFASLTAILKRAGHRIEYFEGVFPQTLNNAYDIILLQGTIVDFNNENAACRRLKEMFPKAKVGIFGDFPSTRPNLFNNGDFVIVGEPESFFLNDFKSIDQLNGIVKTSAMTDYDALPPMDLEQFPLDTYKYSFSLIKKRFITYQSSKGCPYSCSYYCTYGKIQGPKIRQRSPQKIADDFIELKEKYNIDYVQFRDPVFGLNKGFIQALCEEFKKRNVRMKWGMETRLDLLNEENIKLMYDVGLRGLNAGIETINPVVAKNSKRLLIQEEHQNNIVNFCSRIGIKVSAFYIIALETDTEETVLETIQYAKKLNTPVVRFAVSTPYPGTAFYDRLKSEGRLLTDNLEEHNQFTLVFKHENLTSAQVNKLLGKAYISYYARPTYLLSSLKWFFRDLRD